MLEIFPIINIITIIVISISIHTRIAVTLISLPMIWADSWGLQHPNIPTILVMEPQMVVTVHMAMVIQIRVISLMDTTAIIIITKITQVIAKILKTRLVTMDKFIAHHQDRYQYPATRTSRLISTIHSATAQATILFILIKPRHRRPLLLPLLLHPHSHLMLTIQHNQRWRQQQL